MTTAPVKSPLAGYELLLTLALWALSQGCWHMVFAAGEGEAEIEVEPATRTSKTPSPSAPPRTHRSAPKPKVQTSGIVLNMEDRAKVVHADRFKGMSEQQIAKALGWSKSMVHRARIYANKPVQGAPVHAAA